MPVHRRMAYLALFLVLLALPFALGCGEDPAPLSAVALRRQFPAQADQVLQGSFAFTAREEGFETAPRALPLGPLGPLRQGVDGRAGLLHPDAPRGGLRARL